ncbi:unnamed protein product [Prorocentrum cordatum]|uniref:Uncharacterized protein n=1 Tax=Prorocentrum cordatum TaxID=2364126 RepID=A0ABN9QHY9_9DINO|nr:unnamed protein product [Polarella glacialis]
MIPARDADADLCGVGAAAEPPQRTADAGVLQPPQRAAPVPSTGAPAIWALTSEHPGMRAREEAYRAQLASLGSSGAVGAGAAAAEEGRVEDARTAAYAARRDAKRRARKAAPLMAGRINFLSQVPEVEEDVQYRFTFPVLGEGSDAELVVQKVCGSAAASSLPRGLLDREDSGELQDHPGAAGEASGAAGAGLEAVRMHAWGAAVDESMGISRRQHPSAWRCLAVIENPLVARVPGMRKLAKLVFHPMAFTQDVPKCSNRQETLSTTVVTLLRVDRPTLPGQLAALGLSVEKMRHHSRARLRPVRAVVLCAATGSAAAGGGAEADEWAVLLAEFEREHGELWKFGPVAPEDGDALHAAFAEIASVRITGSRLEGAEEEDAEELDDAEEPDDEETTEDLARDGDGADDESCHESECSEGWQRPPVFETEIDGSEVSENAVEFHTRMFSLGDGSS